jgi:hypothetical protein
MYVYVALHEDFNYVGQCKDLNKRINVHRCNFIKGNVKFCPFFDANINFEDIEFKTLEENLNQYDADIMEMSWIQLYKSIGKNKNKSNGNKRRAYKILHSSKERIEMQRQKNKRLGRERYENGTFNPRELAKLSNKKRLGAMRSFKVYENETVIWQGKLKSDCAKFLGVSETSVFRYLKKQRKHKIYSFEYENGGGLSQ